MGDYFRVRSTHHESVAYRAVQEDEPERFRLSKHKLVSEVLVLEREPGNQMLPKSICGHFVGKIEVRGSARRTLY